MAFERIHIGKVLNAVTTTSTSATSGKAGAGQKAFQAYIVGTGAVSATVLIEATNDESLGWILLGTITLSGTTSTTDGFASEAPWGYYRARVTAISGTGAAVTVTVSGG